MSAPNPHPFANDTKMRTQFENDGSTYTGFINDLMTTWRKAEALASAQLTTDQAPTALADCIRYALIRTSINSIANNYVLEEVADAVETGLWSPEKALSVAKNLGDARQQTILYSFLLKKTPTASYLRPQIEKEALEAALRIGGGWYRVEALVNLSFQFGDRQDEVLKEAITEAVKIEEPSSRGVVLTELVGFLAGKQKVDVLKQAAESASETWNVSSRTLLLGKLAEVEEEDRQAKIVDQAIKSAQGIADEERRAYVLMQLAWQLTGKKQTTAMEQAAEAALVIENSFMRADLLNSIAAYLTDDQVERTFEAALATEDERRRSLLLGKLVPRLPTHLLKRAAEAAQAMHWESDRNHVLERLANPKTVEEKQDSYQALMAYIPKIGTGGWYGYRPINVDRYGNVKQLSSLGSLEIDDQANRSGSLLRLAEQFDGEQKTETLKWASAAARATEDNEQRAKALFRLSEYLTGTPQENALEQAVTAAKAMWDKWEAEKLLQKWVGLLSHELKEEALNYVLDVLSEQQDEDLYIETLIGVAGFLTGKPLERVIEQMDHEEHEWDRAAVLSRVIGQLQSEDKEQVLEWLLEWAQAAAEDWKRIDVLSMLLKHLSGARKANVLDQVLKQAPTMDHGLLVNILPRIIGHLSGEQDEETLERVLEASLKIPHEYERAKLLIILAKAWSGKRKDKVLELALEISLTIRYEPYRVDALSRLAELLDVAGREKILEHTATFKTLQHRLTLYSALVGLLDNERVVPFVRATLLEALRERQSQSRSSILDLLDTPKLMTISVFPIPILERIAHDIIDVGWNWRWQ